MNIFIYAHNILSKCKCKKRKKADAIASTSYDQSRGERSSSYTIPCTVHCSYFLLSAILTHRIPHESQALLN